MKIWAILFFIVAIFAPHVAASDKLLTSIQFENAYFYNEQGHFDKTKAKTRLLN